MPLYGKPSVAVAEPSSDVPSPEDKAASVDSVCDSDRSGAEVPVWLDVHAVMDIRVHAVNTDAIILLFIFNTILPSLRIFQLAAIIIPAARHDSTPRGIKLWAKKVAKKHS